MWKVYSRVPEYRNVRGFRSIEGSEDTETGEEANLSFLETSSGLNKKRLEIEMNEDYWSYVADLVL